MNRSTKKKHFKIINGLHPRGTTELRNLSKEENCSDFVEDFVSFIKYLHDDVRDTLYNSTQKYKQ